VSILVTPVGSKPRAKEQRTSVKYPLECALVARYFKSIKSKQPMFGFVCALT
jgi:hypothetical protein